MDLILSAQQKQKKQKLGHSISVHQSSSFTASHETFLNNCIHLFFSALAPLQPHRDVERKERHLLSTCRHPAMLISTQVGRVKPKLRNSN